MSNVGTSVMQVTATDADDPTYGNSARLVYSILQGQPYFSVEPQTGAQPPASFHSHPDSITHNTMACESIHPLAFFLFCCLTTWN
uniref:Cadherin domain-containing protein n=1 Tax=Hucho hucho TaxID=62062 RepID=A0A4W5L6R5_9TELE